MKKIIVIGVIALFIGVSITSSTGKINTSKTNINDGSLLGYVNDTSGNPIEGALVRVYFHETYEEDYSDEDGYYHVTNIPICYCLKNATCSKEGYKTEWVLLGIYENTAHDFVLTSENHPPNPPMIDGPVHIKPGQTLEYTFNAVDPEGDQVSFYIEWGDGTCDGWSYYFLSGTDATFAHTWEKRPKYIRAKAKDYPYEAESNWSYFIFRDKSSSSAESESVQLAIALESKSSVDFVEKEKEKLSSDTYFEIITHIDWYCVREMFIGNMFSFEIKPGLFTSIDLRGIRFPQAPDYKMRFEEDFVSWVKVPRCICIEMGGDEIGISGFAYAFGNIEWGD